MPSWMLSIIGMRRSWSSLNRGVTFASYPYSCDLARIDNIRVGFVDTDDPYGQVAAAEITLTGLTSTVGASAWQDLLRAQEEDQASWSDEDEILKELHDHATLLIILLTRADNHGYSTTSGSLLARCDEQTWRRVGYIESVDPDGMCLDKNMKTKTARIV